MAAPRSMMPLDERTVAEGSGRSLPGDFMALLLQPVVFFRTLPTGRRWAWAALIVLLMLSASALRLPSPAAAPPLEIDPGAGMTFDDPGAIPFDPLQAVLPTDPRVAVDAAAPNDTDARLMTALVTMGRMILAWGVIALVLMQITLFKGQAPHLTRNLHIAVWATLPLAVGALAQIGYAAAGGQGSEPGLSLLLRYWEAYPTLPLWGQALLNSAASQFHLFNLWSLVLMWLGGMYALRGRWWAVVIALLALMSIAVFVPVVTGEILPAESAFTVPPVEAPVLEMIVP